MEFERVVQKLGRGKLGVSTWVDECARLCKPDWIHWCDGSDEEYAGLIRQLLNDGGLTPLNQRSHPGCFLRRNIVADENKKAGREFVTCTQTAETNRAAKAWSATEEGHRQIVRLLAGCIRGRTMYVIPYLMGPLGSPLSRVGVTITDNPYIVLSMRLQARIGDTAMRSLRTRDTFVAGLHVRGKDAANESGAWFFPEDNLFVSHNTEHSENAALALDEAGLRIASVMARDEGWLAERMFLLELESPQTDKTYFAAAFPEGSGLTNLAMLPVSPALAVEGWRLRTVGDRIAWMHIAENGRLWAISPWKAFSDSTSVTNSDANMNLAVTLSKDTFFENVALTDDGTPWWEGCGAEPGPWLTDWKGIRRRSDDHSGGTFAHPSGRFIAAASHCPSLSENWQDPYGVPVSAIVFGSHRAATVPLAAESLSWRHGVFYGTTMSADGTGSKGDNDPENARHPIRRDPMGMHRHCGYALTSYLEHWLQMGERLARKAPPIFLVNWFRCDEATGLPIFEALGENLRSLIWMRERINGRAKSHLTAIGEAMTPDGLPRQGLSLEEEAVDRLLCVNVADWREEATDIDAFFETFGEQMPEFLQDELRALDIRLISRWLNGEVGGDITITGACGRSLVDRRSTDGKLVLHVLPGGADGKSSSPCTRCRRDCVGDLFGLVSGER